MPSSFQSYCPVKHAPMFEMSLTSNIIFEIDFVLFNPNPPDTIIEIRNYLRLFKQVKSSLALESHPAHFNINILKPFIFLLFHFPSSFQCSSASWKLTKIAEKTKTKRTGEFHLSAHSVEVPNWERVWARSLQISKQSGKSRKIEEKSCEIVVCRLFFAWRLKFNES